MTSHRLIRCDSARLMYHAARIHLTSVGSASGEHKRWRYEVPPDGCSTGWHTRLPDGSVLGWCLEVEPGANGVLAHLTVEPVSGRLTLLPPAVQQLALKAWTERQMTVLARAAEPDLRLRRTA